MKHTLTITITENYIPDGDEPEFQRAIERVLTDIAGRAHTLVERHLSDDVELRIDISHPEKEPA